MADESIVQLAVNGHRPRVAVVGGSPAGATVATILVEQFGCDPVCAPTGEAVLSLLRRDPGIDLVVLDLSVPDMDAAVVAQLIRTVGTRGAVPVVALTDERAPLGVEQARAAGFAGAVTKPYSPRELHAAIQGALVRLAGIPALGSA